MYPHVVVAKPAVMLVDEPGDNDDAKVRFLLCRILSDLEKKISPI